MKTRVKKFSELTVAEFYQIAQLRIAVFVVEQTCPYQEVDAVDEQAIHFWLEAEDQTVLAYARIYEENGIVHFGRVLVRESMRGQQLGRKLVDEVLQWIKEHFPHQTIQIGAQAHLQSFYESFGFQPSSEVYLEDDIPHLDMIIE